MFIHTYDFRIEENFGALKVVLTQEEAKEVYLYETAYIYIYMYIYIYSYVYMKLHIYIYIYIYICIHINAYT
jgi:hypothetical protein